MYGRLDYFLRSHIILGGQEVAGMVKIARIREYPVGSSRNEKILTKIGGKLDMLQATFCGYFSVGTS